MKINTPKEVNNEILDFCSEIDPTAKPIFLKLSAVENCIIGECYGNVKNQIKKEGGKAQYGWIIWEIPNIFLEAEFHAVWVNEKGDYVDITPKTDEEDRILFLPDNKRMFSEKLIDNFRKVLVDNAHTRNLIRYGRKKFALNEKYYTGDYPIKIPQSEFNELIIDCKKVYAKELREDVAKGIIKISINKPCPCCSGKKYKMCCGRVN